MLNAWYIYLLDDGIVKFVSDDTIRHSIVDAVSYDSPADALLHFSTLVRKWAGRNGDYLGYQIAAYRVGTERDIAWDLEQEKE